MYKGKDIIGKPIVSYETGEKFDTILDLIFDQDSNQLLGFLIKESSWFSDDQVLLLKDVQAIGPDAIITASKNTITFAKDNSVINQIINHNNILKGTRILTTNGQDLGTMMDLYFDEETGVVEGYEVSGGFFADAYSGRSFVPAPDTLKIGHNVAFVPTLTVQLMEEQVGGMKATFQNVSGKVQEAAQATGDKLQELGRIVSEKAQETAQVTGDKLQELGRSASTSLTNAIMNPEEQKAFVIGKTVQRSVVADSGQVVASENEVVDAPMANLAENLGVLDELYRSTGGRLRDNFGERVGQAMAGATVEQTQGRRIQQMVRSREGLIIAATGQIVTEQVITRAKFYHKEQALMQAVGLSPGDALRDRTGTAMMGASGQLQSSAQHTGQQLQAGAKSLWVQIKDTANGLQTRGALAIEDKRIQGSLGRAVTRVILDQQDQVILNVGELITHQAIASARQAEVLEVLLSSVYNQTPSLTLADLRAPVAGRAAL